jgi:hypothetical protein|uniref:Uncharacterized protein n=2 Tax=Picea TaxID=3328 RepID=A0A101M1G5_PICGL|nr:hypothetical protein ABT39_MTgene3716 [Picea glauca]QHR90292.1 hypothetical protein Q903MT_gene4315 [Picea sitchensis]
MIAGSARAGEDTGFAFTLSTKSGINYKLLDQEQSVQGQLLDQRAGETAT